MFTQLTPPERTALSLIALLLCAGAAARVVGTRVAAESWQVSATAADTTQGGAIRGAVEAELARERIRRTPLAPGERIDVNAASVDELQRLPRVGPALAERIVEHRTARGRFRSLADLDEVPGIGPALLASIAERVDLPATATAAGASGQPRIDVNRATAEELQRLPGIGAVIAARIVEWREANGPFRSASDLEKVPGIGPRLRERLEPGITLGR